jgi:hypothetical protein
MRKMNADLMRAAGLELGVEQRLGRIGLGQTLVRRKIVRASRPSASTRTRRSPSLVT